MFRGIVAFLFMAQSVVLFAGEKERPLKRGHGNRHGNERSARITSLAVGEPVYGGNACPQGTMRVAFAPDYLSFTLLFDQFVAKIPDNVPGNHDGMACDALIPLQIPSGMQMEITEVDFRG